MDLIDRKKKAKELQELVGEFVEIRLRSLDMLDISDPDSATITPLDGYIAQVTENYIYLGDELDEYNTLINIDDIKVIKIVDSLPEELKQLLEGENVH